MPNFRRAKKQKKSCLLGQQSRLACSSLFSPLAFIRRHLSSRAGEEIQKKTFGLLLVKRVAQRTIVSNFNPHKAGRTHESVALVSPMSAVSPHRHTTSSARRYVAPTPRVSRELRTILAIIAVYFLFRRACLLRGRILIENMHLHAKGYFFFCVCLPLLRNNLSARKKIHPRSVFCTVRRHKSDGIFT